MMKPSALLLMAVVVFGGKMASEGAEDRVIDDAKGKPIRLNDVVICVDGDYTDEDEFLCKDRLYVVTDIDGDDEMWLKKLGEFDPDADEGGGEGWYKGETFEVVDDRVRKPVGDAARLDEWLKGGKEHGVGEN